MTAHGRPHLGPQPSLPRYAQDLLDDPADLELQRLRRAGPAIELAIHFADKLLRKGLDPTREMVLAVIEILEADPEAAARTLAEALRAISYLDIYTTTDSGNADRFVKAHMGSVRHCRGLDTWLVWDGMRWLPNSDGQVIERAKQTARSIYREAAEEPDAKRRAELGTWAKRSEDVRRIRAMVELASSDERISIAAGDLDSNPWLLNVLNGTLDLKTGTLRAHDPRQLLTKLAPVEYVEGAEHPVWDEFLQRMIPDQEVRDFLARAAGYSLTGNTGEEVLFLIHGPGGAGKSTFGEAMRAVLGDYGVTADFETFLQRREGGIRNDVARLAGARFVLSLEVDNGRRLAVALLKSMTGRDTVAARFLHREHFEFRPAFKLWLVANHKPKADAADGGLWRRVRLVPFMQSLPEDQQQPEVKRVLSEDPKVRTAILTWMLRGLQEWRARGLQIPAAIRAATERYREECNEQAGFFEECCVFERSAKATSADLTAACRAWCEENDVALPGPKTLAEALSRRGCSADKVRGSRGWRGVRLLADSDTRDR